LTASKTVNITVHNIKDIGLDHGVTVTNVVFPYRPGIFGHSCFGTDRISSLAAFSVLHIIIAETTAPKEFEQEVLSRVLENYLVFFNYGGG